MKTLTKSTLLLITLLAAAIPLTGCAEVKEKSEKATEAATGYDKIKRAEKVQQDIQRIANERNSELEEISVNR